MYTTDSKTGAYTDLHKLPETIPVPRCPGSSVPIRQFAIKQYGRVVNQAVMVEIAKRFHLQGLRELEVLQNRIKETVDALPDPKTNPAHLVLAAYAEADKLNKDVISVAKSPRSNSRRANSSTPCA